MMNRQKRKRQWELFLRLGHLALLIFPFSLTGCATTDDPHAGGFISGVAGLTSGSYEKRISDREQQYQAEMDEQQRLVAEAEAIRRERARVEADLHQANQRLAAMKRKLQQARTQIAHGQRKSTASNKMRRAADATAARIADVDGKLDETQRRAIPVEDLAARSLEINKELDEIDTLVDFVSRSSF